LTAAEIKTEGYIDEMFAKLDEDGSNTLDMGEITALFKENGIDMTEGDVSDMFANA